MKKTTLLILLLISVSIVTAQEGLRVSLSTPSVTFRDKTVGDTAEHFIEFENKNNFPIDVSLEIHDIEKIVLDGLLDYQNIPPGEVINIPYEIEITESGTYSKTIDVIFSHNKISVTPKSFTLTARINFVDVKEKEIITPDNQGSSGNGGGGGGSPIEEPIPESEEYKTNQGNESVEPINNSQEEDAIIEEGNVDEPIETPKPSIKKALRSVLIGAVLIVLIVYLSYNIDKHKKGRKKIIEGMVKETPELGNTK